MDKISLTTEEVKYLITLIRKGSGITDVAPERFKAITYKEFYKSARKGLSESEAEAIVLKAVQDTIASEDAFEDFLSILTTKLVVAKDGMLKKGDKERALKLIKELNS